jgi:uracil-DNA glycosylase
MKTIFDPNCRRCPRLAAFLDVVRGRQPTYYAKPVAPFGDVHAPLLIVGLAPGMHGANRTGRPFTGDFAGILLYATLFKYGLATAPTSTAVEDGLELTGTRITNSVKCLPPENKPTPAEVKECNSYLEAELEHSPEARIIVALGAIAHGAVLRATGERVSKFRFAHGAEHPIAGGRTLIDSYHCSRYNTQTRRLTAAMFESVIERAAALAKGSGVKSSGAKGSGAKGRGAQ